MIWLIGNKGMLGQDVEVSLRQAGLPCVTSDIDVDITNPTALKEFATRQQHTPIKWIINCSAYTAVDRAEEEKKKAYLINGQGVENIADIAKSNNAALIHISTDYVFDGEKTEAYLETDPVNPASVYGASKLDGEQRLIRTWQRHYILRTAWLYGKNGNNFVYTMLRLFKSRPSLAVVADQQGTPTYTRDLAEVISKLIGHESTSPQKNYGIYHYTNGGQTTWFEFAREISRLAYSRQLIEQKIEIKPISTTQYPTPAKRPANSLLSKDKLIRTLDISLRSWQDALADFITNEVKNEQT